MIQTKYLLIGGGLASRSAAKILTMKDPRGSVAIICKEPYMPYDRPPLSKDFLRGDTTEDKLFYDVPSFLEDNRIDVHLSDPAVHIDAAGSTVDLASGEQIIFKKAFIATGGEPITLDTAGADLDGVHYLRSLDDAKAIARAATPGKRAVIIGAGFVGMEVAASLERRGVAVAVVEAQPHIWPRFLDRTFAGFIQDYCSRRGVQFFVGDTVAEFGGSGRVTSVKTRAGVELPCDFVCVGIGIRPETDLARTAGLDVDDGVVVNEYLQTSNPDIYAGGDIVSFPDPVFAKRRRVEHWGHAEYCGQLAALNMTGAMQKYDLLSYVWSDIFDLHIEFAGDETECDHVLLRGELGEPEFTMLYLKDNKLRAYCAVNTDSREFPKLQRLIRKGIDLTGRDADLRDRAFELKSLV